MLMWLANLNLGGSDPGAPVATYGANNEINTVHPNVRNYQQLLSAFALLMGVILVGR